MQVSSNGILSFASQINDPFSPSGSLDLPQLPAAVAPFWSDIDTSGEENGAVYYRQTCDPDILDLVEAQVVCSFPEYDDFRPDSALIVTWYQVAESNTSNPEVTLVCMLACVHMVLKSL